jgi:hypothetical protein
MEARQNMILSWLRMLVNEDLFGDDHDAVVFL